MPCSPTPDGACSPSAGCCSADSASVGAKCCSGPRTVLSADGSTVPSISLDKPAYGAADACCSPPQEVSETSCCQAIGVGEKKSACCDAGESEKSSCCGTQESDVEDDDDSVCACCIDILVNQPGLDDLARSAIASSADSNSPSSAALASSSPVDTLVDTAAATIQEHVRLLRACCAALERYCVRRACCFVSRLAQPPVPSPSAAWSRPATRQQRQKEADVPKVSPSATPSSATEPAPTAAAPIVGEKLELEVRGMDCADCAPKVGRALAHLPSVLMLNLDYFSGIVQLRYDPEILSADAIAKYVARATGFGVKALTASKAAGVATVLTLPVSFSSTPPPSALDGFDTRPGSAANVVELSFPVQGERATRPRDVLQQLQPFGAKLVPADVDSRRDLAMRDLVDVGARTGACAALCLPVLVLAWARLPNRPVLYGSLSVGFTTAIQVVAFPIFSSAARSIVYLRRADMSVLVAVSTLMAYVFSVVSYAFDVAGRPFSQPFFETSALLVTLIFLGRTVQAATRRSTGSAIRELQKLQTTSVTLLPDGVDPAVSSQTIDARLLYYGDVVRIPPDTRIPTDGVVIGGSSDVDESSITGESAAVPKQSGARVVAGTLNLGGTLDVQVTQLVHENSLARITALVKQAQASRSPIQGLADRFSAVILPVATASAAVAFLVWVLVNHYVRNSSAISSSVDALTYAIAVVIVSCPCALGLAVPMVTSVAMRIGIREGVLFRSSDAFQTARRVDVVAFDKTGTLSQGLFSTERAEILVKGAEAVVRALIKDNKHPISRGVLRYLDQHASPTPSASTRAVADVVSLPGKGIQASLGGYRLLGGSATFTGACAHPLTQELLASGLTLFTITLAGQTLALFGLADTPRPDAAALIAELASRGKDVIILSGDTPAAVQRLADVVGVPPENVHAACTPADKDDAIASLQAKGRHVCFVGDGTNDGPALARADVALAVAAGSDVALTAAGAVLLSSDLRRGVLALLDVASAAYTHACLALAWCVIYNVFAILFASGALVGVRIEPRWAGLGEVVSVLPVVVIGLGLDARWAWRKMRRSRA